VPVRIPVVALALVLGMTCGITAVGVLSSSRGAPTVTAPTGLAPRSPAEERGAVGALHAWDAERAAAWARGDAAALSRLYVPGSAAGAADVALLHRYAARGLVVRGLRMQVLRARVLVMRPRRLVLEVTDRLAGAVATDLHGVSVARPLPADRPTDHRLALRRLGGRWLMATVSASGSGGR